MPAKLSFPGLLPAGFHTKTLEEVKILCVENFPNSTTRSIIFESFVGNFITPLTNTGLKCDVWVDGSFITEKEDPEDVDILIEYNPQIIYPNEQTIKINTFLKACIANPEFKCKCHCDVYIQANTNQQGIAYWMGQFAFNRDRSPKGLAVIQINGGK